MATTVDQQINYIAEYNRNWAKICSSGWESFMTCSEHEISQRYFQWGNKITHLWPERWGLKWILLFNFRNASPLFCWQSKFNQRHALFKNLFTKKSLKLGHRIPLRYWDTEPPSPSLSQSIMSVCSESVSVQPAVQLSRSDYNISSPCVRPATCRAEAAALCSLDL